MMTPICPRLLNMINDFVLLRFRARASEDLSAIDVIYLLLLLLLFVLLLLLLLLLFVLLLFVLLLLLLLSMAAKPCLHITFTNAQLQYRISANTRLIDPDDHS